MKDGIILGGLVLYSLIATTEEQEALLLFPNVHSRVTLKY